MALVSLNMTVNGDKVSIDVEPDARLVDVLRDQLYLTGTKEGCGVGECGTCTVIVEGKTVNSCLLLAASIEGKSVVTVEYHNQNGELHPVQEAFMDHTALQCGFCIPGLINSGISTLERNPDATREEITEGISGNLCRCTGYKQVVDAIEDARDRMKKQK